MECLIKKNYGPICITTIARLLRRTRVRFDRLSS
jgi:hypothetical protein